VDKNKDKYVKSYHVLKLVLHLEATNYEESS
jgi:hypothetical protein